MPRGNALGMVSQLPDQVNIFHRLLTSVDGQDAGNCVTFLPDVSVKPHWILNQTCQLLLV